MLRVRVLYLKLRCRSGHRQGRNLCTAAGASALYLLSDPRKRSTLGRLRVAYVPYQTLLLLLLLLLLIPRVCELCVTNLTLCPVPPRPRTVCYHSCESLHA